jgi:hypothetical protein
MVLSKLYDCCAVGRPVIVAAARETNRLAEEAGEKLERLLREVVDARNAGGGRS